MGVVVGWMTLLRRQVGGRFAIPDIFYGVKDICCITPPLLNWFCEIFFPLDYSPLEVTRAEERYLIPHRHDVEQSQFPAFNNIYDTSDCHRIAMAEEVQQNNNDHLVKSDDPEHPSNLIPELCRKFYNWGWVTGTGGGVGARRIRNAPRLPSRHWLTFLA